MGRLDRPIDARRHTNWAIVTDTLDIINDGFTSRESAKAWLDRRRDGYPEPDFDPDEVEIEQIG